MATTGTKGAKRTWDLTWNNYTEADIALLKSWENEVNRMVVSKEVGEQGTPHLQGRITFKRTYRLAALKKLAPKVHWEPTNCAQDSLYVMKDGSDVVIDVNNKAQGQRNDLEDAIEVLKTSGIKRVAKDHSSVFVKFHKGLRELEAELEELPGDKEFVPRRWQQKMMDIVKGPVHPRAIYWIYDQKGQKGKSRLTSHLVLEHGAIKLQGRVSDMAYAYDKHPIVVFDVARTQAENLNHLYSFAEELKNGIITSTKYQSRMKVFKPPHVIFFANVLPQEGVWSDDRLQLINLDKETDTPVVVRTGVPAAAAAVEEEDPYETYADMMVDADGYMT